MDRTYLRSARTATAPASVMTMRSATIVRMTFHSMQCRLAPDCSELANGGNARPIWFPPMKSRRWAGFSDKLTRTMTIHALAAVAVLMAASSPAYSQPAETIKVSVEARSEGKPERDAATARLLDEVRRGLGAIKDVELVSRDDSRRVIWIVAGTTPGVTAASVIVTEHYDRETLMVLGIEDDDMAFRMMALQIVIDHQIFTGRSPEEVAGHIVSAVNGGVFARLLALTKKP